MIECTEDFNNIKQGLQSRGFIGIENVDSWGYCHKNEKHYILRTDGLIKYTTYPYDLPKEYWSNPSFKDYYEHTWGMETFNFKELDEIIAIVELPIK